MKFAKTLSLAAVASVLALNAVARIDPDVEAAAYEPSVTPTPLMNEIKFGERDIQDIEASYSDYNAGHIHHGTPGLTFRFKNTASHERSFVFEVGIQGAASVHKSFSIQPGATAEFTLFLPLAQESEYYYNSERLSLSETTPGAKTDRNMKYVRGFDIGNFARLDGDDPYFLLSAGILSKKLFGDLTKAMNETGYEQIYREGRYRSYRRSVGSSKRKRHERYRFNAKQFKFPAEKWPGDWRIYSTYDSIFITADEYANLGADAKAALETYRTLGGALFVTKGPDGFADMTEAAAALKLIDSSCSILTGDLDVMRITGHGRSKELLEDLKRVPIEAKATIPVKMLLAVLMIFAVVIVPVAVLRSVKRNTRIRLLALLPGSAAVFAVVVAISAYVFFGTTPTVRLQSVTVLDQKTKKAITRGQFGIFSPVSVDGKIAFPSDASFARRHTSGRGDDTATVESADEQRLTDGWVKPLVSSFFDFARVCERPERLDFRVSSNGDVSVVNLLGAKVKWGHVNVGGKLWTFKDVEPGATVRAEKFDKPSQPQWNKYPFHDKETSFGRDWEKCVEWATASLQKTPPGEYVVEVEGSPFFPSPLQRKKANTSAAGLVFGKFKEVAE